MIETEKWCHDLFICAIGRCCMVHHVSGNNDAMGMAQTKKCPYLQVKASCAIFRVPTLLRGGWIQVLLLSELFRLCMVPVHVSTNDRYQCHLRMRSYEQYYPALRVGRKD